MNAISSFFALLTLAVSAAGLRMRIPKENLLLLAEAQGGSSASDLSQCQDQQTMEALSPITRSMSEFFGANGATIYPWVLTMLGALRTGGLSVDIDRADRQPSLLEDSAKENAEANEVHVMDHDIDLLLLADNLTHATNLVHEWQAHLKKTTGLDSADITGDNAFWAGLEPNGLDESGFNHLVLMAQGESSISHALMDTDYAGPFFDRIHQVDEMKERSQEKPVSFEEFLKAQQNGANFPVADFVGNRAQNAYTKVLNAKQGVKYTFLREQYKLWSKAYSAHMKDFTLLDIFVKVGPPEPHYQADPAKKVMLFGAEFPFPKDAGVIHKGIKHSTPYHSKAKTTASLCELFEPHNMLEQDLPPSEQMSKLMRACTSALKEKGYESLEHCIQQ